MEKCTRSIWRACRNFLIASHVHNYRPQWPWLRHRQQSNLYNGRLLQSVCEAKAFCRDVFLLGGCMCVYSQSFCECSWCSHCKYLFVGLSEPNNANVTGRIFFSQRSWMANRMSYISTRMKQGWASSWTDPLKRDVKLQPTNQPRPPRCVFWLVSYIQACELTGICIKETLMEKHISCITVISFLTGMWDQVHGQLANMSTRRQQKSVRLIVNCRS